MATISPARGRQATVWYFKLQCAEDTLQHGHPLSGPNLRISSVGHRFLWGLHNRRSGQGAKRKRRVYGYSRNVLKIPVANEWKPPLRRFEKRDRSNLLMQSWAKDAGSRSKVSPRHRQENA